MEELNFDHLRSVATSGPTPLFATASGAHLYGFPSPDSDVVCSSSAGRSRWKRARRFTAQPSSPSLSAIVRRSRSPRMARPSWSAPARKRC
jgi:hypothetical protein